MTRDDGFELALQLRKQIEIELEENEYEPYMIEEAYREPGTPQRNIVQEYLDTIRATGDRELEEGFTALLTEYLASAVAGGLPDSNLYERMLGL